MSTSSSSYKVAVLERQVASINVTAVANPASVVYSWYSGKLLDKFVASGPLLTLENVTRHQAGSFICVASNSEGSTTLPVILNVQCMNGFRFTVLLVIQNLWRLKLKFKSERI